MSTDIDHKLLKIINDELGDKSADLFSQFYSGFSYEDQLEGARGILNALVGPSRTTALLSSQNSAFHPLLQKLLPISFSNFLFIIFGLLATALFIFRLGGPINIPLQYSIYFLTFPIGLFSIWSTIKIMGSNNPQHKPFLTIFFAILASGIGTLLSTIDQLIIKSDFIVTASTISFFLAYIGLFIGYVSEAKVLKLKFSNYPGILTGFSIMGIILVTIIYKFEVEPIIFSHGPITTSLINLGYVLGDLSLIIISFLLLAISLSYEGGLLSQSWSMIFAGHFMIFIADILVAIFSPQFTANIWPYGLISLIWLISNLLISAGFYGIGDSIHSVQRKIS